jgi:hypothetical protein
MDARGCGNQIEPHFAEMRCGWRALISFTSSVMMECFKKRGLKIQKFDEMGAPA